MAAAAQELAQREAGVLERILEELEPFLKPLSTPGAKES
jgi:hypothetical protein